MKYLKIFTLVTGSVIILFLIVAIFMPSEFILERTVSIKKPINIVFEQVVDLNNFNKWNSWNAMEPSAYLPVEGKPGVGQISSWKGDTVGTGSLKNLKVENGKYIEQEIKFLEPWESKSVVYFKFSELNGETQVLWGMKMNLKYPLERIMKVKLESDLSKSFNEGLANLKKLCEAIN